MPLVLKVTNGPCRNILFFSLVFFSLTRPKANYLNRALKSSQRKIALAMCRESKVNFEPFLQKGTSCVASETMASIPRLRTYIAFPKGTSINDV